MKTNIHTSDSRGLANHGWLNSRHTYSFSIYHNPERMGFGKLRVINDDIVEPAMGFGTHPHENMEIISIPLRGSLRHQDSMGNQHIIESGEVQIMSAGTGLTHSEYNNSDTDEVNFLQIWVLPQKLNIQPRYDQKRFDAAKRQNEFQLVVSPDGAEDSISINQDAYFSLLDLEKDQTANYQLHSPNHGLYIFMLSGSLMLGDINLETRDGVEVVDTNNLALTARTHCQLLCIETPL